MGGVGVSGEEEEEEDTVNEQENSPQSQQQQLQQQQKKAKRLPAFAVAILKRFNEKDSRKNKDKDNNQESANIVEGTEQETTPASNNAIIDGNDNEPKVLKNVPETHTLSPFLLFCIHFPYSSCFLFIPEHLEKIYDPESMFFI